MIEWMRKFTSPSVWDTFPSPCLLVMHLCSTHCSVSGWMDSISISTFLKIPSPSERWDFPHTAFRTHWLHGLYEWKVLSVCFHGTFVYGLQYSYQYCRYLFWSSWKAGMLSFWLTLLCILSKQETDGLRTSIVKLNFSRQKVQHEQRLSVLVVLPAFQ